MDTKRPHIIIINPDQMRADALHHLGNEAAYTPNLDALAEEGVSFSQAYCQNPVCSPSRCSFMTGLYPHTHGHRTMRHLLHPGESTLLKELKDSGYYVWMNERGDLLPGQMREWIMENVDELCEDAFADHGHPDEGRGTPGSDTYYSFYRGIIQAAPGEAVPDTDTVWTDHAIQRIHDRPQDKPLCLFLGLMSPHPPYRIEQKYLDLIDGSKLPPRVPSAEATDGKSSMLMGLQEKLGVSHWSEDRFDQLRRVYLAMCAKVDDLVGRVITALKEEGIYDDALVIVLSDHGDYTGDYGLVEKAQNSFEDCLTRVPFLIKPPAGCPVDAGINDTLVELVDLYATALDFGCVQPDHSHFSRSLKAALGDKAVEHRRYVTCEGGRLPGETHCTEYNPSNVSASGSDEYLPRQQMQASENGAHTKAAMVRTKNFKYVRRLLEPDEFYDLRIDPGERQNRASDRQYQEAILEMKEILLDWYQETCDIVPFSLDNRVTDNQMLKMALARDLPAPIKEKIRQMAAAGKSLAEIKQMLQNMKTAAHGKRME